MELFIETLTGTSFELRVSPLETIMSVKAKIQRLEGIPASQQHLIWRSEELEDECSLQDYKITDGATLKLVISMRGGPINTRRVPIEDPTWKEITEYMEANREEIWEKLPNGRQVTLLVFRDGDQINFFRVVDRGDGTVAPVTESLSAAALRSLCGGGDVDGIEQQRMRENNVTMQKMRSIRKQMEALTLKKKPKKRGVYDQQENFLQRPKLGSERQLQPLRLPRLPSVISQLASQSGTTSHVGRPPGTSVIGVVSRRPPRVLRNEHSAGRRRTGEEAAVEGAPVMRLAAHDCRGLSDVLHGGDGVLRVETSCSSSDNEELESRWSRSSWSTSVMDSTDDLARSDSRSSSALHDGAVAVGMMSAASDLSSRRHLRNSQQHRTRTTIDNFEQLQQTLAKFDPRISVQPSPRSRTSPSSACGSILDGMGFLGRSSRRERLPRVEEPLGCRPKIVPEGTPEVRRGASLRRTGINAPASHNKNHSRGSLATLGRGVFESDSLPRPMERSPLPRKVGGAHKPEDARNPLRAPTITSPDILKLPSTESKRADNEDVVQVPSLITVAKLPPIKTQKKAPSPRCNVCHRKTGLATSYSCRCGFNFCATHRYAEMHDCTYDYKTEGRKFLEQTNPLVTATKLPKI